MTRYVTRATKPLYIESPLWESDSARTFAPDLCVDGGKEVDTGLVSASGKPIYRLQAPIGFGRDGEW